MPNLSIANPAAQNLSTVDERTYVTTGLTSAQVIEREAAGLTNAPKARHQPQF